LLLSFLYFNWYALHLLRCDTTGSRLTAEYTGGTEYRSMSVVAEFARILHDKYRTDARVECIPVEYDERSVRLTGIRAVIFDVYGTLLHYWKQPFGDEEKKKRHLMGAFEKVIQFFGMEKALVEMNPEEPPQKTVYDLYHGLIMLNHEKLVGKGITFPEVRIEEVWRVIVMMLKCHGFDPAAVDIGNENDCAKCMAYYYNFSALGRRLYPGVIDALRGLKEGNIRLGILSNAQFYTPIDLTLLLRDTSGNAIDDFRELFDPDLTFFSYEYNMAKPNGLLFQKLLVALHEMKIEPSETVFVGNDLVVDIKAASHAGMKTAFFVGDRQSAFFHTSAGAVVPDISFSSFDDLVRRISFYEGKRGT
jgi:putative hydrolase of the HAD superfamily